MNPFANIQIAITLVATAARVIADIGDMIDRARAEERDITPEELEAIKARQADAEARWQSLLAASQK